MVGREHVLEPVDVVVRQPVGHVQCVVPVPRHAAVGHDQRVRAVGLPGGGDFAHNPVRLAVVAEEGRADLHRRVARVTVALELLRGRVRPDPVDGQTAEQVVDGPALRLPQHVPQREVDAAERHDGNPGPAVGHRLVVEPVPRVAYVVDRLDDTPDQELPHVRVHDRHGRRTAPTVAEADNPGVRLHPHDDLPEVALPRVLGQVLPAGIDRLDVCDPHPIPPQPSRSYPALQTRSRTIRPVPIQTVPMSGRPRATTPPIIPIPESRQSQFRPSLCVLSARSGSATRPWAGAPSGDRPPRRL